MTKTQMIVFSCVLFCAVPAIAAGRPSNGCSNYVMAPSDSDPITPISLTVKGNSATLVTSIRSGNPYYAAIRLDGNASSNIGPISEIRGRGTMSFHGILNGHHTLEVAFSNTPDNAYSTLVHGGVLIRSCFQSPGNIKISKWNWLP